MEFDFKIIKELHYDFPFQGANPRPTPARTEHYGIRIDKNNPDPYERCTYLYDAEGITPKTPTNGAGGWSDAFFIRNNYPVMCLFNGTEDYKLDPLDHSKKLDGTASDVSNSAYQGNAMSCFDCHIWMKFYEDEDYTYIEITDRQLDNQFVDFPYIRANGSRADKIYYPMFEGTIVDGKLRSIAGEKPQSGTTVAEELAYAQANGSCWSIGDWSHHLWITCLMMLMGKTTDVNSAFGRGNAVGGYTTDSFKTNGVCMTSGQFYGTYLDSTDSMKAFYCEQLYANRMKRTLGLYNCNFLYYVKNTPPYTIDEPSEGYTECGDVPVMPGQAQFYVKNLKCAGGTLLPAELGGSGITYYACYMHTGTSVAQPINLAIVGGDCASGGTYNAGAWAMWMVRKPSYTSWRVGASVYLTQPES